MVYRTVTESSYDAYISECPASAADRGAEAHARKARLLSFPFAVMLKVSYPELDFVTAGSGSNLAPAMGTALKCIQSIAAVPSLRLMRMWAPGYLIGLKKLTMISDSMNGILHPTHTETCSSQISKT